MAKNRLSYADVVVYSCTNPKCGRTYRQLRERTAPMTCAFCTAKMGGPHEEVRAKSKVPQATSSGEETLAQHLTAAGYKFEREFKFHEERGWRFDFAWPDRKVAAEVEGLMGGNGGGRHQRMIGYEKDCEKYNNAVLLGWLVLRVTPSQVISGKAIEWLQQLLGVVSPAELTSAKGGTQPFDA